MTEMALNFFGGTMSYRSERPPLDGFRPLPPAATIDAIIDEHTPAFFRLRKAGFYLCIPTLRYLEAEDIDGTRKGQWILEGTFDCVCGTTESYLFFWNGHDPRKPIDVAKLIEDAGAVSLKHLKDDGFTREHIKRIRKAYVWPALTTSATTATK